MIAGVDEAGRGALAGPVVAAAVILHPDFESPYLSDSKQLTAAQRDLVFEALQKSDSQIAFHIASHRVIDRINILQASLHAMKRSIMRLGVRPDLIRIDGNRSPELEDFLVETVVKGDSLHPEISAASIVAKVIRDRLMMHYHKRYPNYGLGQHKGYATKAHCEAVFKHGRSLIHRQSFSITKQEALFATKGG